VGVDFDFDDLEGAWQFCPGYGHHDFLVLVVVGFGALVCFELQVMMSEDLAEGVIEDLTDVFIEDLTEDCIEDLADGFTDEASVVGFLELGARLECSSELRSSGSE